MSDFLLFLNSSGLLTGIVLVIIIPAVLVYFWQCAQHIGTLCLDCRAEIAQERSIPPIWIQASSDMTPKELAELIRQAEAVIEQERVA